jgi:hypothetical protein
LYIKIRKYSLIWHSNLSVSKSRKYQMVYVWKIKFLHTGYQSLVNQYGMCYLTIWSAYIRVAANHLFLLLEHLISIYQQWERRSTCCLTPPQLLWLVTERRLTFGWTNGWRARLSGT